MMKKDKKKNNFLLYTILIIISFYTAYKLMFDFGIDLYIKSIYFGLILTSLIYIFILGICKKTKISNLAISIIYAIFFTASCIKIYFTNDPILYSDFKYLSDIFEITSIIDDSITFASVTMILPALVYIGICVFLNIKSFKNNYTLNNKYIRTSFIIVPIICFGILLNPSTNIKHFMLRNIYDLEGKSSYNTLTTNIKYYGRYGIISGMYSHYLENKLDIPENYNDDNLNKLLNNTQNIESKKFGKPNIIVLFAESFFDIDRLENEISFDKKITSNFNRLKNEGIYFEMISPSYGGISGNVEFEFLTGANMSYFGNGYVPYMQLYTNKNYYSAPSIVHELNNNGYNTKLVAYTGPRLFNCGKFYKYAGFDYTEYNYDIEELNKYLSDDIKKGGKVSDEHVVDEIIKEFDNKKAQEKELYMTLTMQAHTPYTIDKYDSYDISIKHSNFNKSMNESILSYAQGIYDTDKQLGRLYNYIQTLEEPTMIIFYGDHLPHIADNTGKSMIGEFEYFNTDNNLINLFRRYNTQALILANYEINEDEYKYLSPDLLSAYVLNNMDIKISDYYKWLYSNLDSMPSLNKDIVMDKYGNVYSIKSLNGNLKEMYNTRNSMQYKFFIKDK